MKNDSDYVKKHDINNKARQIIIKLYLSNEDERIINDFLDSQPNKKKYILDLIKNDIGLLD